jgi:hypothetical protein
MANIKTEALCITCEYLICRYIKTKNSEACESCPCGISGQLTDNECYCITIKRGDECQRYKPRRETND